MSPGRGAGSAFGAGGGAGRRRGPYTVDGRGAANGTDGAGRYGGRPRSMIFQLTTQPVSVTNDTGTRSSGSEASAYEPVTTWNSSRPAARTCVHGAGSAARVRANHRTTPAATNGD